MPVAFDAVGPGSTGAIYNNTTSVSYTHPGGASDDGIAISFGYFTSTGQVTSVTVGGVNAAHEVDVYGSVGAEIWGLADLAGNGVQGSQIVAVNFAGATNCFGWCGSVSVTGSDPTTLFSGNATNSTGGNPTVNCPSAVGELVVDALWFDDNGAQIPASTQDGRWSSGGGVAGASVCAASSTAPGAAPTVTMGYTLSGSHGWILIAASIKAAATGQDVTVGQATETDAALALAKLSKRKTIGLAAETDSALAAIRVRSRTVGLATETDSALGLAARTKTKVVGLTTEADSALGTGRLKTRVAGISTEADSALALAKATKLKVTGLATETDAALGARPVKIYKPGLSTETDSALAIAAKKKVRLCGQAIEIDSALSLAGQQHTVTTGLTNETDTALALTKAKRLGVGLASETDTGLTATRLKTRVLGQAIETDNALGLTHGKSALCGIALETDTAFSLGRKKFKIAGIALESDIALPCLATGPAVHTLTTLEVEVYSAKLEIEIFSPEVDQ